MSRRTLNIIFVCAFIMLSSSILYGQKYPERRFIREGNREYKRGNFTEGEIGYRRALEITPDSYEAEFNLGNALYKQQRYDEAAQIFQKLSRDSSRMDNMAGSYYNAGNSLFHQRKLQEALEQYKNALRINPDDMEAKFNLAYVKKLLKEDENKDNNDDQDNQDNQDNQDRDNQDQDSDNDENEQDNQDNRQPPPQGGMTPAEAEQLLQAIQAGEDRTREKVDEENAKAVTNSRNKW